ncbi:hypothetical protein TanjilG_17776 [Lupinus angustifolius]|uniref:FCP1 homology domain-containing protein n=1 Tax=Lupinus angustifolius TaxID=3871 RepID=A0A4P1RTH6_LUPAN|nr:PREDICTED: uncharacterized protein LOC109360783 [Lupinus angustifolius]OIW17940.1 hypothetical protein TanjilG_17776 [Lupinus angustifolius]
MASLKMKSKVSMGFCLTGKKDLHVSTKSKGISKKACSKIVFPDQVAEKNSTIQNWQDVSSRTLVCPKDVASDEPINRKELLNKENSDSQQPQSFSLDSSAVGEVESTNPCTEDIERIVSPDFEPHHVDSQHYTQGDAGRIADTDMLGLSTDENDERRSICDYETCDVSDFFISDVIMASLPFGEDYFDDDNFEIINFLSDYKSYEPTLFDVPDPGMVLPALEDDVNVGSTKDSIKCEETMMVQENGSLYSALCQMKKACNQDSDVKNDCDKTECFDPQLFIENFLELLDVESNGLLGQIPKQSQRRKSVTLVLDLDETLIHSTEEPCDDADFTFNVFYNMKENTVYVKKRPNLHTFLERVSEMFEVVIFTASQSIYAKQLLDILDPDGRLISRRVYRESCIFSHGNYLKDLTVLGVDLTKVAIIDNSPQVFQLQVNNGIPIKSWYDDPLDCALMSLLPFLEILADADDVRPIIAQRFGNKA